MEIGVRGGRIIFERPAVPSSGGTLAGEPRCCQAGLCAHSYVDDPARVLWPLLRESLLEKWTEARIRYEDPVRAWASIVDDSAAVRRWRQARGCGGFRRADWRTAEELVAAALVYTVQQFGPGRICGFTSAPAAALVSSAAGLRFLHLLGGSEMPPAEAPGSFRQFRLATWGEASDAPEAASWAEAEMIVVWGTDAFAQLSPDARNLVLARQRGGRLWSLTDIQDGTAVRADRWIRLAPEKAAAFWTGVTHILLRRYFSQRTPGPFDDYVRRFSDAPLLVELELSKGQHHVAGLLESPATTGEHREGRFLAWDETTDRPFVVSGSSSFRDPSAAGRWNLRLRDPETGNPVALRLSMRGHGASVSVECTDPLTGGAVLRPVPAREAILEDGRRVTVTTVLDLLLAHYGVRRSDPGSDETNRTEPFEEPHREAARECGIEASTLESFALEWGETARRSGGRCLILAGPDGLRNSPPPGPAPAMAHALILTGCMGRRGGGFGFYSGQQKVIPADSWSFLSSARDWVPVHRKDADDRPRLVLLWGLDPVQAGGPGERFRLTPDASSAASGEAHETDGPDLTVDLSFRMDPTALLADVILPAATWYERCDLNSAERTGSIQAVIPAVAPRGESLSEWQIFRRLARRFSKLAAVHLREPFLDPVVNSPDPRDSAPPNTTDGPIRVERDYPDLARRFDSLGPERPNPVFASPPVRASHEGESGPLPDSAAGTPVRDLPDCPGDFSRDEAVCEAILHISSSTNGEAAFRAFGRLEQMTGLSLRALGEAQRSARITWSDLAEQPGRPLQTPLWSGVARGRPYVPFTLNVDAAVPWSTPTGRQQLLAGIEVVRSFGEAARPASADAADAESGHEIRLRYRSVGDKWTFGTLFADRRNVAALFRGPSPVWIHPRDADAIAVRDNDWIELQSGDRTRIVRCVVSGAVPPGVAIGSEETFPFRVPRTAHLVTGLSGSSLPGVEPEDANLLPDGEAPPCAPESGTRTDGRAREVILRRLGGGKEWRS